MGLQIPKDIDNKLTFKICDAVRYGLPTIYMLATDKVPESAYKAKEKFNQCTVKYTLSDEAIAFAREFIATVQSSGDVSWWHRSHEWDSTRGKKE